MTPPRPQTVTHVDADALGALWTAVTRAGGAVGFLPDSPDAEIRAAATATAAEVAAGRMHAVVVRAGTESSGTAPSEPVRAEGETADPSGGEGAALIGSALIGTAFLTPGTGPRTAHRAEVGRLMVHPDAQGTGLGRALLTAVASRARELGFAHLLLSARGGTPAVDFYVHCGWTPVGVWPGVLRLAPGDDRDEHWFHLDLATVAEGAVGPSPSSAVR